MSNSTIPSPPPLEKVTPTVPHLRSFVTIDDIAEVVDFVVRAFPGRMERTARKEMYLGWFAGNRESLRFLTGASSVSDEIPDRIFSSR